MELTSKINTINFNILNLWHNAQLQLQDTEQQAAERIVRHAVVDMVDPDLVIYIHRIATLMLQIEVQVLLAIIILQKEEPKKQGGLNQVLQCITHRQNLILLHRLGK